MTIFKSGKIELLNADCLKIISEYKDNEFDLAIVDPPWGINADRKHTEGNGWICRESKEWDKKSPPFRYFEELFRVSKNQVVWGANHFISKMPYNSACWLIWDKGQRNFSLADGEMAWTSFNTALRIYSYSRGKMNADKSRWHPTAKPIELYNWILHNYAKLDFKILDTHLGSGSSAIAAHYFGCEFVGIELDKEYFDASVKRFKEQTMQQKLF